MNFQSLHLEAQIFCNHLPRNRVIEPSMLHKRLLRQLWRLLIQQPENRSAELHPSLGNHPFGRFLGIISRRFEGNLKETEGDFGVTGGRERVGLIQGGDRFGREGGIGLEPVEHDHWGNDVSKLRGEGRGGRIKKKGWNVPFCVEEKFSMSLGEKWEKSSLSLARFHFSARS